MTTLGDKITFDNLIKVARRKGYKVFTNDSRPYNLNIWGIRNDEQQAGKFDDKLVVFWNTPDHWDGLVFDCTVDPSDHYLLNPIHSLGTAIIKPGQHESIWQMGKHRGYDALVQRKPITVIRDFNKDSILDFKPRILTGLTKTIKANNQGGHTTKWHTAGGELYHIEDTGYFGINLHRASKWQIVKTIGLYSAGCVVIQDPKKYERLINICKSAVANWGNSFTFTLITKKDLI